MNFIGSLDSIFGDGEEVDGDAAIAATNSLQEFLGLFPEDQRITACQIYQQCLRDLTLSDVSPVQQDRLNDVILVCEPVDRVSLVIVEANMDGVERDQLETIIGEAISTTASPLLAFGDLFVGQSGSIYRMSGMRQLIPIIEQTESEILTAAATANRLQPEISPMMVLLADSTSNSTVIGENSIDATRNVALYVDFELRLILQMWMDLRFFGSPSPDQSAVYQALLGNCAPA